MSSALIRKSVSKLEQGSTIVGRMRAREARVPSAKLRETRRDTVYDEGPSEPAPRPKPRPKAKAKRPRSPSPDVEISERRGRSSGKLAVVTPPRKRRVQAPPTPVVSDDSDSDMEVAVNLVQGASPSQHTAQHLDFDTPLGEVPHALYNSGLLTPNYTPPKVAAPTVSIVMDTAEDFELEEEIEQEGLEVEEEEEAIPFTAAEKGKGPEVVIEAAAVELETAVDVELAEEEEQLLEDDTEDDVSDTGSPSRRKSPQYTPSRKPQSPNIHSAGSLRNRGLPACTTTPLGRNSNLRSALVGYEQVALDPLNPLQTHAIRAELASSSEKIVPVFDTEGFRWLVSHVGSTLCTARDSRSLRSQGLWDDHVVKDYPTVEGLGKWEKEMRVALEGVVGRGEGRCLVLLGGRGVGKSLIVNRSINIVHKVYGDNAFITVRLNGLAQTTDRLAMREIARQLSFKGELDEGGDFGSHAATMTTLLRILEPPTDSAIPDLAKVNFARDKPIVFILDEFDLFALHPRQSFVYSLLDIIQGNRRRGGVGVIGISARTDCMTLLEKRVRSRCQSQVLEVVLPKSFPSFISLASSLLQGESGLFEPSSPESDAFVQAWNDEVEAFLQDQPVQVYLKRLWNLHGNNPTFLRQAFIHLYQHIESDLRHCTREQIPVPRLSVAMLPPFNTSLLRRELITGCTVLELSVCIAAKHLRDYSGDQMNLEMLHNTYMHYIQRGRLSPASRKFSKNAFGMAFDRLRALEVFIPTSGHPGNFVIPSVGISYKLFRCVAPNATIDAEVAGRSDASEALKRWCKDCMA